ncbi:hypothetical protein V8B55DRAFT_1560867 [Mucor lusitanicus]
MGITWSTVICSCFLLSLDGYIHDGMLTNPMYASLALMISQPAKGNHLLRASHPLAPDAMFSHSL